MAKIEWTYLPITLTQDQKPEEQQRIVGEGGDLQYNEETRNSNLELYIFLCEKQIPIQVPGEEQESTVNRRGQHVQGIPIHFDKKMIYEIFSTFGNVEDISFKSGMEYDTSVQHFGIDTAQSCADVVFTEDSTVDTVMILDPNRRIFIDEKISDIGMEQWKKEYISMRPNFLAIQKKVDIFMKEFEEKEKEKNKIKKLNKKEPIVDDEGFVQIQNNKDTKKQKSKYRNDNKKCEDNSKAIYKFTKNENLLKKQQLYTHSHNDKVKRSELRNKRKFRPY